ncbi:hypothetical protein E2C01_070155 [Portunus trituberculatus]|uniref:Uncharacterized protein n=1 Tax=Portunus trituberculatus TaxID=210409 RepID=A0A5B7HRZ0_PORTR|nr:hypothetical protein [Portunus trituberculatus]
MGRGSAPGRSILKSSSGVLKSHQHTEVPLSKSSSGITAPLPPRVNFNTTVVTSDDPPPPAAAAPTPSKPPSETHTTGMFVAPVPSCVASAVPVVMSLSASGTSEAAVPVAADLASLCTVASVVTSPASPPASSHASAVPVTTTTGVTSLPTSRSLASPPVAPPRRRRAAARERESGRRAGVGWEGLGLFMQVSGNWCVAERASRGVCLVLVCRGDCE